MLGGQAQTSIRVPVEGSLASVLRLRAHSSELLADMPVTQAEFLENQAGERLPAESIQLNAQLDVERLDDESGSASVRGIYTGGRGRGLYETFYGRRGSRPRRRGAVSRASWGMPRSVREDRLVRAWPRTDWGAPLPGIEARDFEAHGEVRVMRSDSRGWQALHFQEEK